MIRTDILAHPRAADPLPRQTPGRLDVYLHSEFISIAIDLGEYSFIYSYLHSTGFLTQD